MKNVMTIVYILLLLFLAACIDENEKAIYVDVNAYSSGNGSFTKPYTSIQQAIEEIKAGEVVYIRGGVYHEKIHLKYSGSRKKPLILRNYKKESVILDGSRQKVNNDLDGLISIFNKCFIRIEGLTIKNFSSQDENVPVGILLQGNSHDITLKNCQISNIQTINTDSTQANAHAIAVYGTKSDQPIYNIKITQCEVFQNTLGLSEAVALNGNVKQFEITKNKIHDNDNIGIDLIGFEGVATRDDVTRKGICIDNELWNNTTKYNPSYNEASAASIYVDGGREIIIQQNRIWQSDIGIEVASEHRYKEVTDVLINNNFIFDCTEIAGIALGGYDSNQGSASKIRIYNNVLINNGIHILVQEFAQNVSNQIDHNLFYEGEPFSGDLESIQIGPNFIINSIFMKLQKYGNFL